MKGRKAIRNARPKATFDGPKDGQEGGHQLLGKGKNKKVFLDFYRFFSTGVSVFLTVGKLCFTLLLYHFACYLRRKV